MRRLVGKGRYAARCDSCGWTSNAANAQATASTHARLHRHKVVLRVERVTVFDGRDSIL